MTKNSRVYCPWHPTQLTRKRPLLVDDFLDLVKQKKFVCLKKMIAMLNGLNSLGLESPHVKPLFDAIYELKDRTSDSGARVYFIAGQDNEFYAFHAECKKESDADEVMLSDGIEILEALENARAVFPMSNTPHRWRERSKS
jgi:phage-related protein